MTLQQDIQAAVNKASAASQKLYDIVHGDTSSTIETENGTVKTIAKTIQDSEQTLLDNIAEVTQKRDEAAASAVLAAEREAAALAHANTAASHAAEGLYRQVITLTTAESPFTPSEADEGTLYRLDTSAGEVIVNLEGLSTYAEDMTFAFVKVTPDANSVTINAGASDTIELMPSFTIDLPFQVYVLVGDVESNAWIKVAHNTPVADNSITETKLALALQSKINAKSEQSDIDTSIDALNLGSAAQKNVGSAQGDLVERGAGGKLNLSDLPDGIASSSLDFLHLGNDSYNASLNQTITAGTSLRLTNLSVINGNLGQYWDTSNDRFQPPTGSYLITFRCGFRHASSNLSFEKMVQIKINGSTQYRGCGVKASRSYSQSQNVIHYEEITVLFDASSNSYMDFWAAVFNQNSVYIDYAYRRTEVMIVRVK